MNLVYHYTPKLKVPLRSNMFCLLLLHMDGLSFGLQNDTRAQFETGRKKIGLIHNWRGCLTQYIWPCYSNPLARQKRLCKTLDGIQHVHVQYQWLKKKKKKKSLSTKSVHSYGIIKVQQLKHLKWKWIAGPWQESHHHLHTLIFHLAT